MAKIFPVDFEEKLTMAQDDYILFSDSEDGNKIKKAQYSNLKWEKGDQGIQWPQGIQGIQWPKGETWPQWPQGVQWEKGDTWATGATWARINSAAFSGNDIVFGETDGNTVTLSNAKTTLTWPQGEKGEQGEQWETGATGATWPQWPTWPAGNWISSITSSKAWKTTTVTITETNWTTDTFQIQDWADWEGAWDVIWPSGATDWDIVLFDWVTGKYIKDSGKSLNDLSSSWGNITGDIEDQTDLMTALNRKQIVYANCTTAFNTKDKECTTASGDYSPVAWDVICIVFTQWCGVWSPRFSFDWGNQLISCTVGTWPANAATLWLWMGLVAWMFVYDGTYLRTFPVQNTTYSAGTGISISSNTVNNTWVTSFNWSHWAVTYTAPVTSVNGSTWAVTVSAFSPSNAWTTDQVLTKTAGGYAWADASKWIENDTTGTTTTVTKIRAWTEAEYALITPDANTIYYVF